MKLVNTLRNLLWCAARKTGMGSERGVLEPLYSKPAPYYHLYCSKFLVKNIKIVKINYSDMDIPIAILDKFMVILEVGTGIIFVAVYIYPG